MGTKNLNSATDMITFTRASGGTALRKISYGNELVTNGDFLSGTTGWVDGTTYSGALDASSGKLLITTNSSSGYGCAIQGVSLVAGKEYRLTGSRRAVSGGNPAIGLSLPSGVVLFIILGGSASTVTNDFSVTFVCPSSTFKLCLFNQSPTNGNSSEFDNISVKEVFYDQPDGTLQLFNHLANVPRIEYDTDGTVKGLLIEEARTNLLTYSEDFSNAAYGKTDCAVTSNATIAPDGTTTADKLSFATTNSSFHYISANVTMGAAAHTVSAFFKAGEITSASIFLTQSGNNGGLFNLSTGVATAYSSTNTANMVDVGNGWYHCSVTNDGSADIVNSIRLGISNGALNTSVGVVGQGIFAWGAQLEAGEFPTSYIPTSGATATRAADVASIPVDNFGYNDDAGTVLVDAQSSSGNTNSMVASLEAVGDNRIEVRFSGSLNTNARGTVVSNGAVQANLQITGLNEQRKIAFAFTSNDFALSANGSAVLSGTSGTLPTVTKMDIGEATYSNSHLNGHIKSIKYYPRRLSNAQLQELTT